MTEMTPTEDLILTLLVSRRRLGDRLFAIDTRNLPALRRMEDKGLVNVGSGNVEHAVNVSLTDRGLVIGMEPGLTPNTCSSFYIGPRSAESRIDCSRGIKHAGNHWAKHADILVAWNDDEAGGYASEQFGDELRRLDVERRTRLAALVAELRPDATVEDYAWL